MNWGVNTEQEQNYTIMPVHYLTMAVTVENLTESDRLILDLLEEGRCTAFGVLFDETGTGTTV